MKPFIILTLIVFPSLMYAQFGIKAGLNFANITNASAINSSSQTGFHAGVYIAPQTQGILGFRTELLYSKQGYNYKTGTRTGNVNLNYIMLPQLMCINITKYVQLQLGPQMSFLLNATVDSSGSSGYVGTGEKIMDLMNKFDYGYTAGAEIHPVMGLIIGARYNKSLSNLYKSVQTTGGSPGFQPNVNVKNNLVQIFAGWTFGNTKK